MGSELEEVSRKGAKQRRKGRQDIFRDMPAPRISASSYSNTAPLVWSFLYGQNRGRIELIMDTAPARSAELLAQDREC